MSSLLSILSCGIIKPKSSKEDPHVQEERSGLSSRNLRTQRKNQRNGNTSSSPRRSHHLPRLSHFRHGSNNRDSEESDTNERDGVNTMDDYRIHDSDVAVTRSINSSHLEQINTTPTVYRVTDSDIDAHYRVNKNKDERVEEDEGEKGKAGVGYFDQVKPIGEGEGASNRGYEPAVLGDDTYSSSDFSLNKVDGKGNRIDPEQRPANYAIVLDGSLSPGFVPAVQ